jgi:hypothetical protein
MFNIDLITKVVIALIFAAILGFVAYHLEQAGYDRADLMWTKRDAARNQADQAARDTRAREVKGLETAHAKDMSDAVNDYITVKAKYEAEKNRNKPTIDAAFARGLYYTDKPAGGLTVPRSLAGTAGGGDPAAARTKLPDAIAGDLRRLVERADDVIAERDAQIKLLIGIVETDRRTCK